MPNRLNLPEDLEKLIEKREADRRQAKKDSETQAASRRMELAKERRRSKGRRKEDRG